MGYSRRQIDAAQEIQSRKLARRGLVAFTEYTLPGYEPAPHHCLIAEKLEAVARGKVNRLMIFMPPRHGKSELASRRFPAWFLGRYPGRQIMIIETFCSILQGEFCTK